MPAYWTHKKKFSQSLRLEAGTNSAERRHDARAHSPGRPNLDRKGAAAATFSVDGPRAIMMRDALVPSSS